MQSSAGFMRITQACLKLQWPTFEVRELVALPASRPVDRECQTVRVHVGAPGVVAVFAGFVLVMYGGAINGKQFAARRALGWVGPPWRHWLGSAVVGGLLGVLVTAANRSLRPFDPHTAPVTPMLASLVTEPIHNQVLAVTLGPIVEEICLRA
jgi:hypothetical protein